MKKITLYKLTKMEKTILLKLKVFEKRIIGRGYLVTDTHQLSLGPLPINALWNSTMGEGGVLSNFLNWVVL